MDKGTFVVVVDGIQVMVRTFLPLDCRVWVRRYVKMVVVDTVMDSTGVVVAAATAAVKQVLLPVYIHKLDRNVTVVTYHSRCRFRRHRSVDWLMVFVWQPRQVVFVI